MNCSQRERERNKNQATRNKKRSNSSSSSKSLPRYSGAKAKTTSTTAAGEIQSSQLLPLELRVWMRVGECACREGRHLQLQRHAGATPAAGIPFPPVTLTGLPCSLRSFLTHSLLPSTSHSRMWISVLCACACVHLTSTLLSLSLSIAILLLLLLPLRLRGS